MLTDDLKTFATAFPAHGPSNRTIDFLLSYSKAVNIKQVAGQDSVIILN